jgi:hypothetical protein
MPSPDLGEKAVLEDKCLDTEKEQYESRPSSTHEDNTQLNGSARREEEVVGEEEVERVRSNCSRNEDREIALDPLTPTITTESALPPPPDGGLHAWLKVFGGFMIYINIW